MKIIKSNLIWLSVLLSVCEANGQSYTHLFDSLNQQNTINLASELDTFITSQKEEYGEEEAAKMAHDFSVGYFKTGNLELSLKYGLVETRLYEEINLINQKYSKALYQIGFLQERIGEYKKAISYHEKVIELDNYPEFVANSYSRIGSCYGRLGDFYKALDFYKEGIFRLEEQNNHKSLARNYINISAIYSRINTSKSLDSQLEYLNKAEKLQNKFQFSSRRYSALQNSLANYYKSESRFDFEKARYHYNLILQRSQSTGTSLEAHAAYVNLGNLYYLQDLDSALWFLKTSLEYPATRADRVSSYRALSDYYIKKKDLNQALRYIETGITINLPMSGDLPFKNIKRKILSKAANPGEALSAIITRAEILISKYDQSNDKKHILDAFSSLQSADTLVNIIQAESSNELSRLLWKRRASEVYSKAILCSQILANNESAFYFSEKIKALLLTENILQKVKEETLPSNITKKENVIKSDIIHQTQILKQAKNSSEITRLQKELVSTKLKYQQFIDSLRYRYPGFYTRKSSIELFSIDEIQKQLKNNTVIISYVWDTDEKAFDNVYGIFISKTSSEVFIIHELKKLKTLIADFRAFQSAPFEKQGDREAFKKTAHQLYQRLFPTEELRQKISSKKVQILPDNQLHHIPFEALVIDEKSGRYLIENSEISYGYSMSFLLHNNRIKRNASNDFIGIAPERFDYDNLNELSWSGYEVDNIQNILKGKVLKEEQASKKEFLTQSGDYEIIHLATQSNAGENPWIAFRDEKLSVGELYNLKSNADLIFLSSCNTTLGNIAEGEGVLNLARGFFYAGTNSVVSTLWNINDKSASFITKEFYQNIKKGTTKSRALHEAKLQYLKTHSLSDASPYYWASFVLIGDYNAVPAYSEVLPDAFKIVILLICLLILGTVFFFLRKKINS